VYKYSVHRCTEGGRRHGGGGTSCNPSKGFEKLDHKNAIKPKIEDPLPKFFTTPSTPSKNYASVPKIRVVLF
jgi:hypothetical protein